MAGREQNIAGTHALCIYRFPTLLTYLIQRDLAIYTKKCLKNI